MVLGKQNKIDILKESLDMPIVTIIAKYWEPIGSIRERPQTITSWNFDLLLSEAYCKKLCKIEIFNSIQDQLKNNPEYRRGYFNEKAVAEWMETIKRPSNTPFGRWIVYCRVRCPFKHPEVWNTEYYGQGLWIRNKA